MTAADRLRVEDMAALAEAGQASPLVPDDPLPVMRHNDTWYRLVESPDDEHNYQYEQVTPGVASYLDQISQQLLAARTPTPIRAAARNRTGRRDSRRRT